MEIHALVKDGEAIVFPFLMTLDEDETRKTNKLLENIPTFNEQKFKKLPYKNTKVYEIKPTKQVRLLCFYHGQGTLVVTHGLRKKKDKISTREIVRADNFRKEIKN